jgi:multidrug resistance efflux pump
VRIGIKPGEDKDHLLRPGMSVEPKVWLDTNTNINSNTNSDTNAGR